MRAIAIVFTVLLTNVVFAQTAQRFDPVFIVNNEIVSKEKVEAYAGKGYVKSMQNGVSDEKFMELKEKYGDKLVAKEFILLVEIYTEAELKSIKPKKFPPGNSKPENKKEDGYILNVGDRAVNFEVKMINGETVELSELRGKVVLLNFWATWCAPCIREFYEIPSKILDEFKHEDFVFLPVSIGEDLQKVKNKMRALQEKGIEFNSGTDPHQTIWNQYAKGGIPKNFIIGKHGIVEYVSTGNNGNSIAEIQAELKKILRK